jgi:hypothetical protein
VNPQARRPVRLKDLPALLALAVAIPLALGGCTVLTVGVVATSAVIGVASVAVSTAATVGEAAVKGTVKLGEMAIDAASDPDAEPPAPDAATHSTAPAPDSPPD